MFFLHPAAFTLLLHLSARGQGREKAQLRDASMKGFCAVQSLLSPYHPPHYSARR
ncbi:hypothetical protein SOVF_158380 [Spinacia oleracea]|nr:hypothetical protein SOVF_158380 [Spinacia oleracea]